MIWLGYVMLTMTFLQAHQGDASVMFSQTEQEALKEALDLVGQQTGPHPSDLSEKDMKHKLRVDGILFQGPHQWTVWVNGKSFMPGMSSKHFIIEEVMPQTVRIRIQEKEVLLMPNQVYEVETQ
jgi:hypothetical protein